MTDSFTQALHTHMRANGAVHSYYGNESLVWHVRDSGCQGWVIPAGAKASPSTDYQFTDTDADAQRVELIKLDTPVSCECGEYKDRTVVVEGTFSELLVTLLSIDVPTTVTF